MLLLLQFGTQNLECAISGNYHGMLYLQTIPGSLVVANRTQIPTRFSLYRGSTVPKIDVNVIKWNAENSRTVEQFWLCLGSQIRPEGGLD